MAQKLKTNETKSEDMAFTRKNYQYLLISMAIVAVGFLLMIGDENIYDVRKTIIAPMTVLVGFGFGIYAILKK